MSLGLDGSCLAPGGKGLGCGSRLAASIRTLPGRALGQGQVRASTEDSCVLEGRPVGRRGLESPMPAMTQGHAPGGGPLPHARGSYHHTPDGSPAQAVPVCVHPVHTAI